MTPDQRRRFDELVDQLGGTDTYPERFLLELIEEIEQAEFKRGWYAAGEEG